MPSVLYKIVDVMHSNFCQGGLPMLLLRMQQQLTQWRKGQTFKFCFSTNIQPNSIILDDLESSQRTLSNSNNRFISLWLCERLNDEFTTVNLIREIKEKFLCRLKAIHKAQRVRRLIQLAQEEQEGKTEHYT